MKMRLITRIAALLPIVLVAFAASGYTVRETKSNTDLDLYVSPSGTPTKALSVAGASGAVTVGAAGGSQTHTLNGNIVSVDSSTAANTAAYIRFRTGSPSVSTKGIVGSEGAGGTIITGTSAGDLSVMAASGNVQFSGNNGSTIHGTMSSAGQWTLGAASGTGNHVVNGNSITLNAAGTTGRIFMSANGAGSSDSLGLRFDDGDGVGAGFRGGLFWDEAADAIDLYQSVSGSNPVLRVTGGTVTLNPSGTTTTTLPFSWTASQFTHTAVTSNPLWLMQSSRNTIASPTAVAAGDTVGLFLVRGYDGAGYTNAGGIRVEVDNYTGAAVGTNDMPARTSLLATADGSPNANAKLAVDGSGLVIIGPATTDQPAYWPSSTTGTTTCDTACQTEPASANTSSGRCISAWNASTRAPLTGGALAFGCADATSTSKICMCAALRL